MSPDTGKHDIGILEVDYQEKLPTGKKCCDDQEKLIKTTIVYASATETHVLEITALPVPSATVIHIIML